jgi:YgiT-type zinc finger domain-containing protein
MEVELQEQEIMRCVVCNQAETVPGTTSVLLERDQLHLTIHHIPAQICPKCGETYADETVTAALLREAEKISRAGTKVDVREYALTGD